QRPSDGHISVRCILLLTASCCRHHFTLFFLFTDPPPTEIYTLSLHDALPISFHISGEFLLGRFSRSNRWCRIFVLSFSRRGRGRSEEHTSELQSRFDLVCRLLLEKKKHSRRAARLCHAAAVDCT